MRFKPHSLLSLYMALPVQSRRLVDIIVLLVSAMSLLFVWGCNLSVSEFSYENPNTEIIKSSVDDPTV